MRENRQYGSEGGEVVSFPYPYQEKAEGVNVYPATLILNRTGRVWNPPLRIDVPYAVYNALIIQN